MENCPVAPNERQVTFVLAVLPQNAAVLRKQVKQWSDCIRGIATQCVVCYTSIDTSPALTKLYSGIQRQGKYERSNDQYCNNLALKCVIPYASTLAVTSWVAYVPLGLTQNAEVPIHSCDRRFLPR